MLAKLTRYLPDQRLNRFCEFGYHTHLLGFQEMHEKWLGSLS